MNWHVVECVGIEIVVLAIGVAALVAIIWSFVKIRESVALAIESGTTVGVALNLIGNTIACVFAIVIGLALLWIFWNMFTTLYHGICLFMGHGA